jgi:adenylate kinase
MKENKKNILIFLGPPGSGKGTQTDMLAKKLNLPAISPGELLRQEVKEGTVIGKKVEKKMAGGALVDNRIVAALLDKRLDLPDAKKGVIFDGFPRNVKQMPYLKIKLDGFNRGKYNILAFYIYISDQEAKKRLSLRRVCFCGATYHLTTKPSKKPGICDVCGRRLEHRQDDKLGVVSRRLKIFHKENDPIMKYFKKNNFLLKISGEQEIKKIQKDILRQLAERGIKPKGRA